MNHARPAILAGCLCVAGASAQPATLTLRGGERSPEGTITQVTIAGVTIAQSSGATGIKVTKVVSWDRVTSLEDERAHPFLPMAASAWRGRIRLQRGDFAGALGPLEEVFESTNGQPGVTPALVASGLLRARLATDADAAAVDAWLALLASNEPEPKLAMTIALGGASEDWPALLDADTGLCPALPPMWLAGPALESLAEAWERHAQAHRGTRAGAFAAIYAAAARLELAHAGGTTQGVRIPAPPEGNDRGLALAWNLAAARSTESAVRARARAWLEATLLDEQSPGWIEAWVRLGRGASLLMEDDQRLRELGIAESLHLPARFAAAQPKLSAQAMARCAAALARWGDAGASARVRAELARLHPHSPALLWLPHETTAGNNP
jgi:hypothetical protein